jgi:hypothetical protein
VDGCSVEESGQLGCVALGCEDFGVGVGRHREF